jgi:1-acyl-sn-glycerol-3-phosphate acyltransferase
MFHEDIKRQAAHSAPCLFIGQDHLGRWVVKHSAALAGGLFVDRAEAIRFAMYECQRRPQSVIMLPNGLELDTPVGGDHRPDRATGPVTSRPPRH